MTRGLRGAAGLWPLWPELLLILGYWATRLHRLTGYPVFDDEAIHIRQAKMVWKLLPFSGADDGRVLNILLYAPFWPFGDGALWVSRAAYVIVGAAGLAALVAAGRLLLGPAAGRWAGLAFILMPFAFFFERIALADTLGLPLLGLAAWASLRAARRADMLLVLAGGLALAGLLLAKLSNLVYIFVPLLAVAMFGRRSGTPRLRLRGPLARAVAIYAVAVLAIAPIVLFLVFRAHSSLGFANVVARTGAAPLGQRFTGQLAILAQYPGPYLTWPLAALALLGLGRALWRREQGGLFAGAILVVPLLAFTLGANSLESRYLAPLALPLALLAGHGAGRLAALLSQALSLGSQAWLRAGSTAIVGAGLALGGAAQFVWAGWHAPARLALPALDRPDYVEDWPSGFSLPPIEEYILRRASQEPLAVVVTEGWHLAGLTVHYGWERNLRGVYAFSETDLKLAWLQTGCEPFELFEEAPAAILYVAQRERYHGITECLRAEKSLIDSFPKPGAGDAVDLYELRPLP
jgi:hypothetical protein